MRRRLLLTGAGSAATSNLMRSLRAGYRSLTIVGWLFLLREHVSLGEVRRAPSAA